MDKTTRSNIAAVMEALTANLEIRGYYHIQGEQLYKFAIRIIQKMNGNIEAAIAETEVFVKRNIELLDKQNSIIDRAWGNN